MTAKKTDKLLTGPEAAERVGLAPATWRSYVRRGLIPPGDEPGDGPSNRAVPKWLTSTVDHFAANRLGRGARTDRKATR